MEKIKNIIFKIGHALAELHNTNTKGITNNKDINIDKYLNKIKNSDETKGLKINPQNYGDEFIRNPGVYSYLHGDSQPGNYIIDPTNQDIYIIDLGHFAKHIDEDGHPCGFAAHEYFQFLSSLDLHCERFKIETKDVQEFKSAFKEGYQNYLTSNVLRGPTKESLSFFELYWEYRKFN